MSKYHKALQSREPITVIPDGTVRADLEAAIASITAELRGPLSNTERIMLVHDRDDRRDILALMDARDHATGDASNAS